MSEETKNENNIMKWAAWDDNWATGLSLVLIGGLFLLHTFGLINVAIYNWWAIFILIPGMNMTVKGWRRYGSTNSKAAMRTGIWGLVLILVAFTFLFGISWNLFFPLILIGVGLTILLTK